jgi:transcriptional regulator with XRE-family HTH domain
MSAAQLADKARISRSYLSELENGKGAHKRPSAQVLYRIGKALGISMSELMGRPFITGSTQKRSASLERFAASHRIPDSDVEMLASIRFRGDPPQTEERWEFIYNAIKASVSMDPPRRRG